MFTVKGKKRENKNKREIKKMLKHSYALKMGAKKNNPTLNQVRVKEQKKNS